MFRAIQLWWKNLFKHKDDGYTNTEGESHKYTSLMTESVKLEEESYAFIDKKPPHLVLDHMPLEMPRDDLTPRDKIPTPPLYPRDEFLDLHILSHPNFKPKLSPIVPKRPPISMKQRFQQRQYRACLDDITTDTPSKNTRSKQRRKKKLRFKDCFTQTSPKTSKNIQKPTIS